MIRRKYENFDLAQIADSGQCFRMIPSDDGDDTWSVTASGKYLKVSQDGSEFTFSCSDEEFPFWEHYFDLDTDYGAYIASVPDDDEYLSAAARYGSGIRILNQDPWEMIITFLISQQKTIPNIRSLVESLSRGYGREIPGTVRTPEGGNFFSFPTPEELNRATLEDLTALKLGYRAKYIKRTCEDACSGKLDIEYLETLDYSGAMDYLVQFYGIGEKVANCICLFGLHHIEAFPVDTWIRKILLNVYAPKSALAETVPESRLCKTLIDEFFGRYEGYAGIMQQYIFYYERTKTRDSR